jgi:NAD(P)-dependent dehydrogenase (short-subunit alcohol dehydrogenase family)
MSGVGHSSGERAAAAPIRFDGQVALVTGAGRGLGRAYALELANRGAQVVLNDAGVQRDGSGGDPDVVAAVAREIGSGALASSDDVRDPSACDVLVARVVEHFGRLDALVHNAGTVSFAPLEDTTDEAWRSTIAVHADAAFWLCRTAWPVFRRQAYGRIVLTVSGVALSIEGATDDLVAYSAGKGAQFGLLNALAVEGAPVGIRVNAVSPVAATRMSRSSAAPAEHVAPVVAFLASRACATTGAVVRVAGSRISTGGYVNGPELDVGEGLITSEQFAAALPQLIERKDFR